MSKKKRYKVIKGSESAHCCFGATVIDTARPDKYMEQVICECFDIDDAKIICDALNKVHEETAK